MSPEYISLVANLFTAPLHTEASALSTEKGSKTMDNRKEIGNVRRESGRTKAQTAMQALMRAQRKNRALIQGNIEDGKEGE